MEPTYWLTRQKEEAILAHGAASAEAKLVHHELATRYGDKASQAEADTLARWGIERIPADRFWVNGFSYNNVGDAIKEAVRGAVK